MKFEFPEKYNFFEAKTLSLIDWWYVLRNQTEKNYEKLKVYAFILWAEMTALAVSAST